MPLISAANLDAGVLQNLVATLKQVKVAGPLQPLLISQTPSVPAINYPSMTLDQWANLTTEQYATMTLDPLIGYTIYFYVDEEKEDLLFADHSQVSAQFSQVGVRMFYTPTDEQLNTADGLSNDQCQPLYYVTVVSYPITYDDSSSSEESSSDGSESSDSASDETVTNLVYRNIDNLTFQDVVVLTPPARGQFPALKNVNAAALVPLPQRLMPQAISSNIDYLVQPFDLYVQILDYDWTDLSEQNRIMAGMNVGNLIRNALYADRYRANQCCTLSPSLDGTNVSQFKMMPSDDALRGVMHIECVSKVSSTTY